MGATSRPLGMGRPASSAEGKFLGLLHPRSSFLRQPASHSQLTQEQRPQSRPQPVPALKDHPSLRSPVGSDSLLRQVGVLEPLLIHSLLADSLELLSREPTHDKQCPSSPLLSHSDSSRWGCRAGVYTTTHAGPEFTPSLFLSPRPVLAQP